MVGYLYQKMLPEYKTCLKRFLSGKIYTIISLVIFFLCLINNDIKGDQKKIVRSLGKQVSASTTIKNNDKAQVAFVGNSFFSAAKLYKKLLILDDPGFIEPNLIAHELLNLYKNNGFTSTKVKVKQCRNGRFLFHILEGNQAQINSIQIIGDIEPKFSPVIKTLFSKLQRLNFFDKKLFNVLVSTLNKLFFSYGYWDFKLKKHALIFNNKSSYDLILEFEQGPQSLLNKIVFKNEINHVIDSAAIKLPIFNVAIPFDLNLINSYKNKLADITKPKNQKIFIKDEIVLDKAQSDQKREYYALVLSIINANTYFGEIKIHGCVRTVPAIIMQHLTFQKGDIWDFDKIEQSLQKLRDLKIFKSISIIPNDFAEATIHKTITINVIEDDVFETIIRLGFTQGSDSSNPILLSYLPGLTYKFGGSFLWKNISGISDFFRLDLDYTGFLTSFSASYKRPLNLTFFPGLTIGSQLFNKQLKQSFPGVIKEFNSKAYTENHTGFLFNLDYHKDNLTILLSMGFDSLKLVSLHPESFEKLHIDSNFFRNQVPYYVVEPSIMLNTFDNDSDPSNGFKSSLSLKAMMPFQDLSQSFYKLLFEHFHIIPITLDSSLILKLRSGYIVSNHLETILPTERFYLGGFNTVRGYEKSMVPPINSFFSNEGTLNGEGVLKALMPASTLSQIAVPIGAKFMANVNVEWRCKLYDKVSAIIFNDMGLLTSKKFQNISMQDFVAGTGCGLLYATPIGPLRFDIGFKWKRQKNEKPFAWYLNFGHSF